ncbi:MAG: dockerin type I repeat-containing protein [Clostridia bacterium]|nr:dockerin type I repeat-containing protein [Clostridia bacterium]
MQQKIRKYFFSCFAVILLLAGILPAAFAADCTHEWGKWTADETAKKHIRICSVCADVQKGDCSFTDTVVSATCLTPGYTKHICKDCGYTYMDTTVDALGHDWQETDREDATCTQDGYIKRICTRCKTNATQVLTASHTYSLQVIPPTCTSDGCDRYTCINCNHYYTENIIKAPGHKWKPFRPDESGDTHTRTCEVCSVTETENCSFDSVIIPPDCTNGGFTDNVCSVCEQRIITDYTQPRGHNWDEGVVKQEPTCLLSGNKLCTCTRCPATTYITVPATGNHTEVVVPAQAATCTQNGKTEWSYCSVCETTLTEARITAATGHSFTKWTTLVYPTCGDGLKESYCDNENCNEYTTAVVTGDGKHEAIILEAVSATCFAEGLTAGSVCTVCDTVLVKQFPIPAKGHDWQTEWTTELTCTQDGICNKTCKNCKMTVTNEKVLATGHSFTTLPSVAATCTQTGLTMGVYCKNCNTVTKEQQIVPMKEHDYQLVRESAATCDTDGFRDTKCKNCTATEHIVIPKFEHDIAIVSQVEPKCESVGIIVRACQRENCRFTSNEEIPATGHSYSSVTVSATCTQEGYTRYTCSTCKHTYDANKKPAAGHKGTLVNTVAPTCTAEGYDNYYCNVCKQHYSLNKTPAAGHKWDTGTAIAATCTENGYILYTCTACTATRTETTDSATGHSFISCSNNGDGTHSGLCKICERNITEKCNGGLGTCQQKPVCRHCNTEYGDSVGEHRYTQLESNEDAHTYLCEYCAAKGTTEAHILYSQQYLPALQAHEYRCNICDFLTCGRPVGDIDGDGQINAADARLALRYAVGLEKNLNDVALAAADSNEDGKILADDARMILRKSVGLHTEDLGIVVLQSDGTLAQ